MISPAGFNKMTPKVEQEIKDRVNGMGFFKWSLFKWVGSGVFEKKKSPFEYFYFPFKGYMINKYLNHKRFNYSDDEKKNIGKLMRYFMDQKQYSERCIGYLLKYGTKSGQPIGEIVQNSQRQEDIFVYYGERDWMDSEETLK